MCDAWSSSAATFLNDDVGCYNFDIGGANLAFGVLLQAICTKVPIKVTYLSELYLLSGEVPIFGVKLEL